MIPFVRSAMMARSTPPLNALYVGLLLTTANKTATPSTIGATVGDLAVAIGGSAVSSGGGGTWTLVAGANPSVRCKPLNASDLVNQITFTDGGDGARVLIYRGASSMISRAVGSGTGTFPDVAGFAKSANHAGLFARVRTNTLSMGGVPTMKDGSGIKFVSRTMYSDPAGGGALGTTYELSDWRSPERTLYVDGTAFEQNYGGGSTFSVATNIFEFLA